MSGSIWKGQAFNVSHADGAGTASSHFEGGLQRLKKKFIIAPQSNGNISLLVNMAKAANLPWDVILGAEIVQTYKPRPEAYERACDALGLTTANCMMVAAPVSYTHLTLPTISDV